MSLKVIYIDDEPDLCEIFSDEFATEGITILTFTNVKVAVETILKNPPDVIFIDYRLPATNGDEVAATLPPEIPKYLLTGEVTVETNYKFRGILSKPWEPEAIKNILASMLKEKLISTDPSR